MSGEEGGSGFPPLLLYSTPFPLPPGLDPCGGGAPLTPSQSVKAQNNLLGLNSRCSPYLCISVCFPVNWGQ